MRTQKRSAGSSALSPVSGMTYIPQCDTCVITLSDGSLHAVHRLSVDPSLDPLPSEERYSSAALSMTSRAVFARVEAEKVIHKDVDRISGMTTYDSVSTFAWTYE